MNKLITMPGAELAIEDGQKLQIAIKTIFGLTDKDQDSIEFNTSKIKTPAQAQEFISFAESEMNYLIQQEEISKFQKYNRMEKFSIVCRKFNKDIRLADKEQAELLMIPVKLSTEEQFLRVISSKLMSSLRNMRALRDLAARNREYYKTLHLEDLKMIGLSEQDFSILHMAVTDNISLVRLDHDKDIPVEKLEVPSLIRLMQTGSMGAAIKKEVDRRVMALLERKDSIKNMASGSTSAFEKRLDNSIAEYDDADNSLISKMDEVYNFVEYRINRDWNEIKVWGAFKITDSDGKKTDAFSTKEVFALEAMGGWDAVIKIVDQDRLPQAVSRVFKDAISKNKNANSKINLNVKGMD